MLKLAVDLQMQLKKSVCVGFLIWSTYIFCLSVMAIPTPNVVIPGLKPPETLSLEGNVAENWRLFKQQWNFYSLATSITDKPQNVQCAIFLCIAGIQSQELANTFVFADGESRDVLTDLVTKFERYCNPRKNTTYERYIFNQVVQDGRNFDVFLTELKQKSKTCEFGEICDSLIRDRIVIGIDDNATRERLLREVDFTLDRATTLCRASEQCKVQSKTLSDMASGSSVDSVRRKKKKSKSFKDKKADSKEKFEKKQESSITLCGRCGNKVHKRPDLCPAYKVKCHKCSKRGHFASFCKSTKVDEIAESSDDFSDDEDDIGSLYIHSIGRKTKNAIFAQVKLNDVPVAMKLDTGAAANVVSLKLFEQLDAKLHRTKRRLTAYGGKRLPVVGKSKVVMMRKNGNSVRAKVYVVDLNSTPLLGLKTIKDLELIHFDPECIDSISSVFGTNVECRDNSIVLEDVKRLKSETKSNGVYNSVRSNTSTCKSEILDEYSDVFKGLGRVDGKYEIVTDPNVKPSIEAQRKVPLSILPRLKEKLNHMIELGVISRVDQPVDWVSNLVVVEKANGSLRICLDPPKLNKAIKRDICKPPSAETVSSRLNGKTVFSVIDMSDCFWHVELTEKSSLLCTLTLLLAV